MKKETIEKLINTISDIDGVACVMFNGEMLIVEPKKPIFVNSLGDEFYNSEERVFWFDKTVNLIMSSVLRHIDVSNMSGGNETSEIYKAEETVIDQRNKYKESLKPIYRAFKLDEAEEYLGLKIKSKKGEQRCILDNVINQNCLNVFFDKFTKLDGSPIGKIEE